MIISKLWYIGQIYTIPKYQKGNWKKNIQFPLEQVEIQPPRHLAQLSIWRGRLGILGRHTIKLYKNKMDSEFIKPHHCSLERSRDLSPTGTPRQIHVEMTWKFLEIWSSTYQRNIHVKSTLIRRGYYIDMTKTKFRRISMSFPWTFSM